MYPTDSSPHQCMTYPEGHPFHRGGRCWCQPRRDIEAVFDVAVARNLNLRQATELLRQVRGQDNVVTLRPWRRAS